MVVENLIGNRYGRLVVIERADNGKHGNAQWVCLCDCGRSTTVPARDLKRGHTTSCGCAFNEIVKAGITRKHGKEPKRLYNIWIGMKERCYNKKADSYQWYGARGITVCEEWRCDYEAFRDWAFSHGYKENLTIDRIDVDKGYEPQNCQWLTSSENTAKRNRDVAKKRRKQKEETQP